VLAATDLFPSLCAIAGVPLPPGVAFDGEDLSAPLTGTPTVRTRTLFWEYGRNTNAFNFPKGKDRSPNVALREGDWKLLVSADGSDVQLYNLRDDPKETVNVADQHPDIARRLADKALAWRNSLPILKNTVEPTQRRKGAKSQGFRLLGTLARQVSNSSWSFPPYLPVSCVLASWRLCVNHRFGDDI
jgi:arylsulfatase A-like enzyme